MPDFCMCKNEACEAHKDCLRFTDTPHEYCQSYANFAPFRGEKICDYFKPNKPEEKTDAQQS